MTTNIRIKDFLKHCAKLNDRYSSLACREVFLTNTIYTIDNEGPRPGDIPYKSNTDSIVYGTTISSILLGLLGSPVAAIILLFFNPSRFLATKFHWSFAAEHPFWTHMLVSVIIVSILAIPIAILMCKEHRADSVERYNSYQEALEERPELVAELESVILQKEEVQKQLKQLSLQGVLHEDYIPYANKLLRYIEIGRADTLKEAINLLEHNLEEEYRWESELEHRREIREQAQKQQEVLSYIAEENKRAADAAESAAFWSAADTLLTAADIKERHKNS